MSEVARLFPEDIGHGFGRAVALWGDVAIVGAKYDFERIRLSGAAYVFHYDAASSQWREEAKLFAADGAEEDLFGSSVALDEDLLLIGAPKDDDNGRESGSAYVFRFDRGGSEQWVQEAKLLPDDGGRNDWFGWSVRLADGVAVIGAGKLYGGGAGVAYVFRYDEKQSRWVQEAKLVPRDGSHIGAAMGISDDDPMRIFAGSCERGADPGAVFVFRRDSDISGEWIEETALLAEDGRSRARFGLSVHSFGGTVLVGAPSDTNENGRLAGAAYVFELEDGSWVQKAKLIAPDGAQGDSFGQTVGIGEGSAVVAAISDDDDGEDSGSAYVFHIDGGGSGDWVPIAKLRPPDGVEDLSFGVALELVGDVALIGSNRGFGASPVYDYRGLQFDCNGNLHVDMIDICDGSSIDCQTNGVPDQCDIAGGRSEDQDQNGIPDECEGACCMPYGLCVDDFPRTDCPGFFASEVLCEDLDPPCGLGACCALNWPCELLTRDECLARGCNREYDWQCDGDVNGDGLVNPTDVGLVEHFLGSRFDLDLCNYDMDCDGQINAMDVEIVQSLIGTCAPPRDSCFSGTWHEGGFCEDVECP